jgi:hypothetical protein
MGVAAGDVDGDGRTDLLVTNLDLETNALYANLGDSLFSDARFSSRLAAADRLTVGFGAALADFDQDGDLDLVVANGHIIHNVEEFGTGTTYRQRNQLFENRGDATFLEVAESGLDVVRSSRGLAVGDLDGDGDLDLAISNSNDLAEVYENIAWPAAAWLAIDLLGAEGNRLGIGARVEIKAGDRRQIREVRTSSSYQSQHASTAHFGLGASRDLVETRVRWPGGGMLAVRSLPASRRVRISADGVSARRGDDSTRSGSRR